MSGFETLQDKLIQAKRVMDAVENNPTPTKTVNTDLNQPSQTLPPISNTFNTNSIDSVIRSNSGMNKPTVTEEKVKNSNLPDAIKKLMIDHPIPDVNFGNQLPDALIEGAAEKMRKLSGVKPTTQSYTNQQPSTTKSKNTKVNTKFFKKFN